MARRIAIILSHPDPQGTHFGNALAEAYALGARDGGHQVETIDVARLEFPLLRTKQDFDTGEPPETIRRAQDVIARADHLVIFFPLWLGTMPALLKGFLEQVFRPRFATGSASYADSNHRPLSGKRARIVVTMGMPALVYRWYFRAHGLKSLERNVLKFCRIGPVKESLIGVIEEPEERQARKMAGPNAGAGTEGRLASALLVVPTIRAGDGGRSLKAESGVPPPD